MIKDNTGKLAVITGASNGIGYEWAVQFLQVRFDLFLASSKAWLGAPMGTELFADFVSGVKKKTGDAV